METARYYGVSHRIPFCLNIFTCKCSLQWVIGLVWGPWILLCHQFWIPTETPRYPVVMQCHEYSATLVLHDHLIYMFPQFIDGLDVGLDQLKTWIYVWMVAYLFSLTAGQTVSNQCQCRASEGWGQLSWVLQVMKGRAIFSATVSPTPVFLYY